MGSPQEHILRSTSIVKMGTTTAEFEVGDLSPGSVATIAAELGVPGKDVVEMNPRMSGASGSSKCVSSTS